MLPPMSWHVYLLRCADGALYCGVTTDVARRLAEHNGEPPGAGAKYTRARRPVRLAASAPCADKPAALRLELAVKKRPRAAKLAFLLGQPGAQPYSQAYSPTYPLGDPLSEPLSDPLAEAQIRAQTGEGRNPAKGGAA